VRLEQAMELARRFHEAQPTRRPTIHRTCAAVVDAVDSHDEKLTAAMHDLLKTPNFTAATFGVPVVPAHCRCRRASHVRRERTTKPSVDGPR